MKGEMMCHGEAEKADLNAAVYFRRDGQKQQNRETQQQDHWNRTDDSTQTEQKNWT